VKESTDVLRTQWAAADQRFTVPAPCVHPELAAALYAQLSSAEEPRWLFSSHTCPLPQINKKKKKKKEKKKQKHDVDDLSALFESSTTARSVALPRLRTNAAHRKALRAHAYACRNAERFSYAFDALYTKSKYAGQPVPHEHSEASCSCALCRLERDVLRHPAMDALLGKLTGRGGNTQRQRYELDTMFASRYRAGDFLARHNDRQDARAIAFVLQLSKQWRFEYGGLLVMLGGGDNDDDDDDEDFFRDPRGASLPVRDVLVPRYNTLTLFEVRNTSAWHFVSEVARAAPRPRFAVSGWFRPVASEEEQPEQQQQQHDEL
jgi:hypothetical protein